MNSQYLNSRISDFVAIRKNGLAYIDKTMYIPQIEHGADYTFYIRPHGMGATTLISMLKAYYDINLKDQWNDLFKNLYISSCPTPGRSQYLIGHVDFRHFSGNIKTLKKELYTIYFAEFNRVLETYEYLFSAKKGEQIKQEGEKLTSPTDYLNLICSEVKKLGYKFYLFVDGFDAVADCLLEQGGKINYADDEFISNMRTYFKFFDSIYTASQLSIAKIFAVGTIPIAITKFFAGFKGGIFYTTEGDVAQLSGFTPNNVRALIDNHPLRSQFKHTTDELIDAITNLHGGYCFSTKALNEPRLIRCKGAITFIEEYVKNNFNIPQQEPQCDICPILRGRDHEYDQRTSALRDTLCGKKSIIDIEKIIPIDRLDDTRYFFSMLYYRGSFTIIGEKWGKLLLGISNSGAQNHINKYLQ